MKLQALSLARCPSRTGRAGGEQRMREASNLFVTGMAWRNVDRTLLSFQVNDRLPRLLNGQLVADRPSDPLKTPDRALDFIAFFAHAAFVSGRA